MWWNKKKKKQEQLEIKDLPLSQVRKAIHEFTDHLPDGVELRTVINEDLTLDYNLLAPYLKGIPKNTYYMSKETYELFEEKDHQLALDLDHIQRAVDHYIKQNKELPIIENDPYFKVNYFKLEKAGLIHERPERDFYITDDEHMITYKRPEK
ncbi:DUF3939 domain-containing protein [Pontibacillus sp. ALD_SL1]|uniref:DUF3939 domain-containing protein n=1 Tax=Pontibacillus sp. ALD_SL1 TaxID=2777185 RepID=UPI001A963F24|nr:DUF3939 domain-containing protein [Pontibacillus sp. ALD_SL1]QST00753.1 DUF3939 domain-containing protein [Pontibacillus sp. ALD_SL1]